jgi:hypothetical protein
MAKYYWMLLAFWLISNLFAQTLAQTAAQKFQETYNQVLTHAQNQEYAKAVELSESIQPQL